MASSPDDVAEPTTVLTRLDQLDRHACRDWAENMRPVRFSLNASSHGFWRAWCQEMSASPPAFECAGVEKLSCRSRRRVLALVLGLGVLIALWHLGTTGLIDETPPLFAAAARGMAETGDWLTPRVNGLPRYDKPPLIYWLMGVTYALPGHGVWDPLGSWAPACPQDSPASP